MAQSCCFSQYRNNEASVTIYYVDYEIMTPFKITNQYFNEVFIKESDSILITDNKVVNLFIQSINELEVSESASAPDVRQKVIINNHNEFKEIVLYSDGEFAMMRDDEVVLFSPDLQKMINEIIKSNEKIKSQ